MSSEIRSFIRQIEKWFVSIESRDRAIDDLQEAIKTADSNSDYLASYNYLMKLAEFYPKIGKKKFVAQLHAQAMIRALAIGKPELIQEAQSKMDPEQPFFKITQSLADAKDPKKGKQFYLLDLEYQTIFGDFIKMEPLPMIDFEDENEAQIILEDFFQHGYYHVHMIERTSLVKERVDIAVGKKEKLDNVETVHKQILT